MATIARNRHVQIQNWRALLSTIGSLVYADVPMDWAGERRPPPGQWGDAIIVTITDDL